MKVGSLVEQATPVGQMPDEDYHGKLGVVVEVDPPRDEFDFGPTVWVQWQGNCDWDIEPISHLKVVSS